MMNFESIRLPVEETTFDGLAQIFVLFIDVSGRCGVGVVYGIPKAIVA
jgi:hypothetical protein